MRLPRVVASAALIVALALVAVPGPAGSQSPSSDLPLDSTRFQAIDVGSLQGSAVTTPTLDPAYRSNATLGSGSTMLEPARAPEPAGRPATGQPEAPTGVIVIPVWHYDPNVSFYGPGFYGQRTACGYAYTTTIMGVAHRTLPCGTMVRFKNPANGRIITVPVIDRGPYVSGRQWDLSGAACRALNHCYTGSLFWRFP